MTTKQSSIRDVRISKITLNVGVGKDEELMKKGLKLLQKLTPLSPVKTVTKKRIPGWGLRPGLTIGCKVTIRKDAETLLRRLLVAKEKKLSLRNFDDHGNFSFGIPEYIDIEGLEYDPELKILGLEAAVTLERPGFRVKHRKMKPAKIGKAQCVAKEDAVAFVQNLGVEVE